MATVSVARLTYAVRRLDVNVRFTRTDTRTRQPRRPSLFTVARPHPWLRLRPVGESHSR
jgi:hypothetical protein